MLIHPAKVPSMSFDSLFKTCIEYLSQSIIDTFGHDIVKKMTIYDFYKRKWIEVPTITIDSYSMECEMTTLFDKEAKQAAVILITGQ